MRLPPSDRIITLAVVLVFVVMVGSLVVLTFMHPDEFRTDFRQILGVILAAVIGYSAGSNKNKPS